MTLRQQEKLRKYAELDNRVTQAWFAYRTAVNTQFNDDTAIWSKHPRDYNKESNAAMFENDTAENALFDFMEACKNNTQLQADRSKPFTWDN